MPETHGAAVAETPATRSVPDLGGVSRGRRTSRWVRVKDRLAERVIRLGGLAVIAAMLGICAFLVQSALPLLLPGEIEPSGRTSIGANPIAMALAEGVAISVDDDAHVRVRAATGETLLERSLGDGPAITAATNDPKLARFLVALDDGSLRAIEYEFDAIPVRVADLPERYAASEVGQRRPVEDPAVLGAALERVNADGVPLVVRRDAEDLYRVVLLRLDVGATAAPDGAGPVVWLHEVGAGSSERTRVVVRESGDAVYQRVRLRRAGLGGRVRERITSFPIMLEGEGTPDWLFGAERGGAVWGVSREGALARYVERDGAFRRASSVSLMNGAVSPTAASMALGGRSVLIGMSDGSIEAWSVVQERGAGASPEPRLTRLARLRAGGGAIGSIATGVQGRTVAASLDGGDLVLINTTSTKRVGAERGALGNAAGSSPVIAIDPELRAAAWASGGSFGWLSIDAGHPSASAASLFGPLHYEGYDEPGHVYQSSGSDESEPKYGLVPLIYGTLKATVIAMLISAPLGVLAAVYSSEFLHPNVRRVVKPVVELMASLPSVVLGFIGAMVVAPWMRDHLPQVIGAILFAPIGVAAVAHAWRAVPAALDRRVRSLGRAAIIAAVLLATIGLAGAGGAAGSRALFSPSGADLAVKAGSVVEADRADWPDWLSQPGAATLAERRTLRQRGLYIVGDRVVRADRVDEIGDEIGGEVGGDDATVDPLRGWLDGEFGDVWPGWFIVLWPLGAALVLIVEPLLLGRLWTQFAGGQRARAAAVGLVRLGWQVGLAAGLASGLAVVISSLGFDARDSLLGPFSQRNTLVVGVVMGFAVIPLIYTISEDALRSVPENLRAASLGSGATPWQTAVRVVLPVAGSGVFSACMIGMGRAVGETMIVLMATGNTPEISANIFGGFRTLAANIAVELPEAPRGETHYRVL
ncbi:MAG: ABC transporter permease subunit, partial [Planctomycetota bacterium]